jgi:23S rRNA (adenine2503-C2)-methyltransferase
MVVEQRAHSFEDMTNVSSKHVYAESNFVINHIKVDTMQRSEDGTGENAACMMVWWSNRF